MPIIYQHRIYRQDLMNNRELRYVFGDNYARTGLAGQAKEMRGEPNAIGVVTMWRPSNGRTDFFADAWFEAQRDIIDNDLKPIKAALKQKRIVVLPLEGLGTGRSQLLERSPKTWNYLQVELLKMRGL